MWRVSDSLDQRSCPLSGMMLFTNTAYMQVLVDSKMPRWKLKILEQSQVCTRRSTHLLWEWGRELSVLLTDGDSFFFFYSFEERILVMIERLLSYFFCGFFREGTSVLVYSLPNCVLCLCKIAHLQFE